MSIVDKTGDKVAEKVVDDVGAEAANGILGMVRAFPDRSDKSLTFDCLAEDGAVSIS
jgi:hypothetical protein